VGDDLNGAAQIVAAPLFGDDFSVDLAVVKLLTRLARMSMKRS